MDSLSKKYASILQTKELLTPAERKMYKTLNNPRFYFVVFGLSAVVFFNLSINAMSSAASHITTWNVAVLLFCFASTVIFMILMLTLGEKMSKKRADKLPGAIFRQNNSLVCLIQNGICTQFGLDKLFIEDKTIFASGANIIYLTPVYWLTKNMDKEMVMPLLIIDNIDNMEISCQLGYRLQICPPPEYLDEKFTDLTPTRSQELLNRLNNADFFKNTFEFGGSLNPLCYFINNEIKKITADPSLSGCQLDSPHEIESRVVALAAEALTEKSFKEKILEIFPPNLIGKIEISELTAKVEKKFTLN